MRNKRLEDMCKSIDVKKLNAVSQSYAKLGVDKCRAPFGCESIQYGCRAWRCKYIVDRPHWQNDPQQRY